MDYLDETRNTLARLHKVNPVEVFSVKSKSKGIAKLKKEHRFLGETIAPDTTKYLWFIKIEETKA